jgi:predicted dienelactone hydrolase
VVFSHGFQLTGDVYEAFGNRMASHGIIGVFPSYGDSLFTPLAHTELATLVSRMLDWSVAQSTTRGSRLFGQVDTTRLGAAGHSRGGKQSILATIEDPRIGAVFGVDPVDSGPPFGSDPVRYPSVTPERMDELTVPAAFLGAGRSAGGFQACAPAADNYHAYYEAAGSPSYEYNIIEGGHLDFTDSCGLICITCTAGDDADFSRSFAATTLVAFFRYYLAEDARYRPWIDGAQVTSLSSLVTFASR